LLDAMTDLRKQGATDEAIARGVGVSRRTVSRYVGGVPVMLERKQGLELRQLLKWCMTVLWEAGERLNLSVDVRDRLAKLLEVRVRELSGLTVEQLRERDDARRRFLVEFFESTDVMKPRWMTKRVLIPISGGDIWGERRVWSSPARELVREVAPKALKA